MRPDMVWGPTLFGKAVYIILFWIFNQIFNVEISIIIAIATGILITGAFHDDGFADTFEGFGGGWTKEKILEIMKDSRIGAYGAISLIVLILLKLFTFSSLVYEIQSLSNQNINLIIFLIYSYFSPFRTLT